MNKQLPRVYLAGPDVFFRDSGAHFDALEQLCQTYGLQGVRPSDGGISEMADCSGGEKAQHIYDANMRILRSCDATLANLMPFRGAIEPDSGTVFEVGATIALGKPVAGYLPNSRKPFEDKVIESFGAEPAAQGEPVFDATYGLMVEQFQQPLNLMIARSSSLFCTVEAALEHLAATLVPKSAVLEAA